MAKITNEQKLYVLLKYKKERTKNAAIKNG